MSSVFRDITYFIPSAKWKRGRLHIFYPEQLISCPETWSKCPNLVDHFGTYSQSKPTPSAAPTMTQPCAGLILIIVNSSTLWDALTRNCTKVLITFYFVTGTALRPHDMPRLRKMAGERRTCVPDFFSPGLTHVVSLTGSAGSEAGQPYKGGCTEAL